MPESPAGDEVLLNLLGAAKALKLELSELTRQKKQLEEIARKKTVQFETLRNEIAVCMATLDVDAVEIDGLTAKKSMATTTMVDEAKALEAIEAKGLQRQFMKVSATALERYGLSQFVTVERMPSVTLSLAKVI